MRKIFLQQLIIYAPKIYALGKSSLVTRNIVHSSGRRIPCISVNLKVEGYAKE
jgi:hypothetical protein